MQYDPKQVILTFGGVLIEGYAEGTFIDVAYDADLWTKKIGADGFGIFSKSNDLSATTTLRLMPGVLSNQLLSSKVVADIAANIGFGPLVIIDPSTGTTHTGARSRIMKMAGKVYAQEAEALEWVIGSLELLTNHGPSTNPLV